LPNGVGALPFGLWVAARQSIDMSNRSELRATLHVFALDPDGSSTPLEGDAKGGALRTLREGIIRREPADHPGLVSLLSDQEKVWVTDLRRPTEEDRANRVAHVVTPLIAVVVS
jgi:hypothetical protein